MDTVKTAKAEALELLEKIDKGADATKEWTERFNEEREWFDRLNKLTIELAESQGVRIRPPENVFIHFSIDACFKLPIPGDRHWQLITPSTGTDDDHYIAELFNHTGDMKALVEIGTAGTLPVAMLIAWWKLQD